LLGFVKTINFTSNVLRSPTMHIDFIEVLIYIYSELTDFLVEIKEILE